MVKLFNNDEPWGGAGEWDEGTRHKTEALSLEAKMGIQHPDGEDPRECWGDIGRRLKYWKARAEEARARQHRGRENE